jgi:hypothetical protein
MVRYRNRPAHWGQEYGCWPPRLARLDAKKFSFDGKPAKKLIE